MSSLNCLDVGGLLLLPEVEVELLLLLALHLVLLLVEDIGVLLTRFGSLGNFDFVLVGVFVASDAFGFSLVLVLRLLLVLRNLALTGVKIADETLLREDIGGCDLFNLGILALLKSELCLDIFEKFIRTDCDVLDVDAFKPHAPTIHYRREGLLHLVGN